MPRGAADLIDATHTVTGQPLPTGDADLIYGLGGGDTIAALKGSATANPHQLVRIGKNLDHFDHHDILVICAAYGPSFWDSCHASPWRRDVTPVTALWLCLSPFAAMVSTAAGRLAARGVFACVSDW